MALLTAQILRQLSRRLFSRGRRRALLNPVKSASLLTNNQQATRNILFKMSNDTPPRVVGYYVIFPVIPDETVENNKYLANIASSTDWPLLSSATPKEMYEGTLRLMMEYGATVMEHLEHLKTATCSFCLSGNIPSCREFTQLNGISAKEDERSFETVVDPLLTEEYDVNYAFQTLILKMLTDWPLCSNREFESDMHHVRSVFCSTLSMFDSLTLLNYIIICSLVSHRNHCKT
ncbi:unnamed protein product [Anisakis simplex]|uniref:Glutamate decarboxylase n=1 Tax=Anisakis simplex TaxID=6269 RepID=A0A0M3J801_ANISI|nr:unnamed protein product [Anisakis simplex]